MNVGELTRELVAIPSHESETAAGDYIEKWLRAETDAAVNRDSHGNVIARRGDGEKQLALVGHHDVVPPAPAQQDDETGSYSIERRDGRLYGRGTADMKGAVAAAMCAFRDAALTDGQLAFASFVGEETGGRGARGAIDDGFVPDRAIVGEGSTGYSSTGVTDVAIAHKGRRASTIHATGTASHASEPETGANAIYRATDAIQAIRDQPAPETDVLGHRMEGSVVVTEIEGGSAWNVVPDQCAVTVDERTVPDERISLSAATAQDGLSVTVEQDLPPMACGDPAFAELVVTVATESQDGSPEQVLKPHATDAGWLAAAGTDCVVCGPSEPGEAHTASESVSLAVLERCYDIYRYSAERFSSL